MLTALGYDKSLASAALRITLGPENTREEIDGCIIALRTCIGKLRKGR